MKLQRSFSGEWVTVALRIYRTSIPIFPEGLDRYVQVYASSSVKQSWSSHPPVGVEALVEQQHLLLFFLRCGRSKSIATMSGWATSISRCCSAKSPRTAETSGILHCMRLPSGLFAVAVSRKGVLVKCKIYLHRKTFKASS